MNRKKILIVDDNPIILKTLSLKLAANGYTPLTSLDGATAVKAVREQRPDLIILDVNFPPDVGAGGGVGWDGFKLIQWLRRLDEARNTPIIVITGGDSTKFKQRALDLGAVAFFHKPIDNDELLDTIKQALNGEEQPASTPPTTPAQ